jgi:polyferredoxin
MRALAADLILIVHFAFVSFVVGGLAATWIGAGLHWRWVRRLWFRVAHLAAICFVAGEAVLGVMCPLTVWEDALRGRSGETAFIARWVHRVMFYDLPEWVFTAAYVLFALVVALTWWLVPPRRRQQERNR